MEGIKRDIIYARHGDEVRVSPTANVTDKPCLDEEGALYRIEGGVTIAKIQYRASNGSNIAPLIGYQVTKGYINEEGDWLPVETLCITKEEGLEIALAYNYRNAYVATSVKKRRGDNEVSHYLKPYPAKEESFTRDDAIVQAYEVDANGVKVQPYELTLAEDDCSPDFWAILESDYESKTRGNRERVSRSQAIKERKMAQLKKDLKTGRHNIVNPYRKKAHVATGEVTTDADE